MRIAHVSTFPPLQCGIAFYVTDLIKSLVNAEHERYVLHYGTDDTSAADGMANVWSMDEVRLLAERISRSDSDVVSLQHEFGIWGGEHGEHILAFLEVCDKPIVTTLHTTFEHGRRPLQQRNILEQLLTKSEITIALTTRSRNVLLRTLGEVAAQIKVVPHGVPHVAFQPMSPQRPGTNATPWRFCSIGFLRPDKGVENILQALHGLRSRGLFFKYQIAGGPQAQFEEQRSYLNFLERRINDLGLQDSVSLDARFFSLEEQISLIQSSHAAIFAYQDPDHASSGTIPLTLAAGRPAICTPFEYAKAKMEELDAVVLAKGFDAAALESAIAAFCKSELCTTATCKRIYQATRCWTWPEVGEKYHTVLHQAVRPSAPSAPRLMSRRY